MSTVLLLVRREDEPEGLIHIALAMVGAPFNYSVVCDTALAVVGAPFNYSVVCDTRHNGMRTVNHRKGFVPTCLQCIATLQNRYWNESFQ